MTQIIPLYAKVQFNKSRSLDKPLLLLTITDGSLVTPLRFSSYPVERLSVEPLKYGIVSNAENFEHCLSGSIPSDQENSPLSSQLVLDNIDLALTDSLIDLTNENDAQVDLVLASAPDTLIRSFPLMMITQVDVDEVNITITLERNRRIMGESSSVEPYPSGLQTYQRAPGLHR